ncbi:MAG: TonB-dependent receptor, partial [Chitinophagaceae bacterium]
MNMKFLPHLLVALLMQSVGLKAQNENSVTTGTAQITQTIKGSVIDKTTRLPMPGVTVRLSSNSAVKATTTGQDGVFSLRGVPLGRQSLQASAVGYQPVVISELLIISGKELIVNLEMEASGNHLDEVVVNVNAGKKPLNQMAMGSGRSFSPEETNRFAGAFFDPARMAQSFAGVVAGGDDNEIIVRGNSPKSLQWRLEGIEIINPNHFGSEGASGGAVSMINTTVLSTSDFYTGGLAAEYSNALSGVFDLKFRKGNTDKREYALNLGILGAGATLEGPFRKGGSSSYLVSYRYSSLSLLEKAGIKVADEGVPKYQDLSFNFVFPTKKAGTFSLFGIGGLSELGKDAERDYTKWEERMDGQDMAFGYNAGSAGLKHMYIANNKLYFNNIISVSGNRSSNHVDTLTNDYQKTLSDKNLYTNTSVRYSGIMNYNFNSANVLRAGVNVSLLNYNLYGLQYNREINAVEEVIDQKGSTGSYDAFMQLKSELGAGLTLNTGVHTNYFVLSKSWSVEPRLGLNLELPANQQLSLAAGMYSRLEPLSYYFAKGNVGQLGGGTAVTPGGGVSRLPGAGLSSKLEPTKSAQAVFGYEKLFGGNLKFKTEVYYQHLYDVPVSVDPTV